MKTKPLPGIVHSDPKIMGGTPVFIGTRVPLQNLVDYLEGGESIDDFLDAFPTVKREQVVALISVAEKLVLASLLLVLPQAQGCGLSALIGSVVLHENASVWFNAVLRGDNEPIVIGEGTNVQDGCVLHTDPGYPLTLGRFVTVGHMAMLHGCTIGDCCLIGINAVLLNGARIGRNCLIGANTLISEGKEIAEVMAPMMKRRIARGQVIIL